MDENGILARIPGEYVSDALKTLPKADTATQTPLDTQLDVPGIGRVRFSAKRLGSKKGKSTTYFWSIFQAIKVDE
jgi:hypothetical protein